MPRSGGEAGLSAEVQRLLREVVADGLVLYCCGPKAAPFALVAGHHGQGSRTAPWSELPASPLRWQMMR
ncbi:MAG: hypothetical protein WBV74_01055 [Pseudonocardiaceae bacterium]